MGQKQFQTITFCWSIREHESVIAQITNYDY